MHMFTLSPLIVGIFVSLFSDYCVYNGGQNNWSTLKFSYSSVWLGTISITSSSILHMLAHTQCRSDYSSRLERWPRELNWISLLPIPYSWNPSSNHMKSQVLLDKSRFQVKCRNWTRWHHSTQRGGSPRDSPSQVKRLRGHLEEASSTGQIQDNLNFRKNSDCYRLKLIKYVYILEFIIITN